MATAVPPVNLADTTDALLHSDLEASAGFYGSLVHTADAVERAFEWAQRHSVHFVPLLDFDVVCSALPSVIAQRHLEEPADRRPDTPFRRLLGPHSLSTIFFGRGPATFSLPLGTLAELVERRTKLHGALQDKASQWLDAFHHAQAADDPETTIIVDSRQATLANILVETVNSITANYDDLVLLENIQNNHQGFDQLVLDRPDPGAKRAFAEAHKRLSESRRDVPRNNRIDAINVSNVVRMVNRPVQLSDQRPMPLFITGTREVYHLEDADSWYDVAFRPPRLFNRVTFLHIYWHFLTEADFDFRRAQADLALFARQTRALERQYSKLLDHRAARAARDQYNRALHDRFVTDRLIESQRAYDDYWGRTIVGRPLRSIEHDRVSLVNLLQNQHFRNSVERQVSRRLYSRDWDGLMRDLSSYAPRNLDLWTLINNYRRRNSITFLHETSDEFVVTVAESSGDLLIRQDPGRPIGSSDLETLNAGGEVRFLIHRRRGGSAAILAIEAWLEDSKGTESYALIAWAHGSTRAELAEHVQGLSWFLDGPSTVNEPTLEMRLFTATKSHTKQLILGRRLQKQLRAELASERGGIYTELRRGHRVFFFDLEPVESLETQMGIVVTREGLAALPVEVLAEFIVSTTIEPITVTAAASLIDEIIAIVNSSSKSVT